ncbi:uncharacterized protein LOC117217875 [Megalopta genalis]|uniref:uncharacterized protein LOC117217875 n=1 Tax=Megalopta genalis TaxID=115081 RepID=UPI003FD61D7C
MSHVNQEQRYEQIVHKLLKIPIMPTNKLRHRQADHFHNTATEISGEIGTTDRAIGDVTAEIMITTLGKIPNEMYYIEDTNPPKLAALENIQEENTYSTNSIISSTEMNKGDTEPGYSPVLVALLCTLVVILFMCCITACLVAKSKRRNNFFNKGCDPVCTGMSQPLLDKISECSNKTSSGTQRN